VIDTPTPFVQELVRTAHVNGTSVVAVAKRSTKPIAGRQVHFWLDDAAGVAGYRLLTPLMSAYERP
jgi:hypothetical protein